MPGILCSVYDPTDVTVEPKWRHGLELVRHHPEHVLEQYSEPGFQLACVYHPEVCQGPRILVTEHFVLACYGNIYEDEWAQVADGETLCRVLLDAFLARGIDALKHLNGRYDIAIWDRHARIFHLVSDRFGANRHYLLQRPGALHLACEVKALAVFLDHIEIDPAGLASMLTFGYHIGDLTLLRDIRCLPNARHLVYRATDDRLSIDRYWNYPYGEREPLPGTEAELAAQLHDHLLTALKRQLRGVKKILLPISGGLDSRSMAGLLTQSGFTGEVLAYSYGQPSSRDVRYGRAIAKKLGYRHVTIPTPKDFITRHLEQAAWQFDAEWSGELNWTNFAHTHTVLGDVRGFTVLSGMYGDAIMGEILHYKSNSDNEDQFAEKHREYFIARHQEYMDPAHLGEVLNSEQASKVKKSLEALIDMTFMPMAKLKPYYAQVRAQFEHRVRRHTAMVAQCIEVDYPVMTPFLDTDLVDFTTHVPFKLFRDKELYKHMIRNHLPMVAAMPYAKTGLPLAENPFRIALHWRWERILNHLEKLRERLIRRNAFFNFNKYILSQRNFLNSLTGELDLVSPPLDPGKTIDRYRRLLNGHITPADQVCAFLTPAIYLRKLNRRLAEADNDSTRVS